MSPETTSARLDVLDFPVEAPGLPLLPPVTSDTAPFHEALAQGVFALQTCTGCGRFRYPVAPVCPWCTAPGHEWSAVSGRGQVRTWVRYHRAFASPFVPLIPYLVVAVELDEGPCLIGRLVGPDRDPAPGDRVVAVIERWSDGARVVAFVPAGGEARP